MSRSPYLLDNDPSLRHLLAVIRRCVESGEDRFLFEGGSGTGKEVVAWQAHCARPDVVVSTCEHCGGVGRVELDGAARTCVHCEGRGEVADRPFVVIDCSKLTETLVGSQLFGHKKGAFSGSIAAYEGLLLPADGGTVVFDELHGATRAVQMSLLRFLQTSYVEPIGVAERQRIDVMVIGVTSGHLEQLGRTGLWNTDLNDRFRCRFALPDLRVRSSEHKLSLARATLDANPAYRGMRLSDAARTYVLDHPWPNNVRQMQATLSTAANIAKVRGSEDEIDVIDLVELELLQRRDASPPPAGSQHPLFGEVPQEQTRQERMETALGLLSSYLRDRTETSVRDCKPIVDPLYGGDCSRWTVNRLLRHLDWEVADRHSATWVPRERLDEVCPSDDPRDDGQPEPARPAPPRPLPQRTLTFDDIDVRRSQLHPAESEPEPTKVVDREPRLVLDEEDDRPP